MRRQQIALWAVALSFTAAGLARPPVPRIANELKIVEPSGKQTLLTSQKGEVVLVQFLYTNCIHCQATARVFSKLQKELGPRGLKVFGVAFNDEVQGTPEVIPEFIRGNAVTFPVGAASRDTVLSYLGISIMSRFVVPQVLVVDRRGVVRAQTEAMGSPELQDEMYMRSFLDGLLKEGAPLRSAQPKPVTASQTAHR
jgi:peroxiredoxin